MSILIDATSRIVVVGLTGGTARVDAERSLRYGARILAGVSPGKAGEMVHAIPVYDTIRLAMAEHQADTAVVYVPAAAVRDAVMEAVDAGLRQVLVTAEYVPLHDVAYIVAACRIAGIRLIGCNTNGVISPGRSRIGGIGGSDPSEIYVPGRIGICSRSGGMSAEIALAVKDAGLGVSTCVSMGGDAMTGMRMADFALLFEDDPGTDAIIVFGEPGTRNEQELAAQIGAGRIRKPVLALIAGQFQETYPQGATFGHTAAVIGGADDSASAKRALLASVGVHVCGALDDIGPTLRRLLRQ